MSEVSSSRKTRRPDRAALVIAPALFIVAVVIWWDAARLSAVSNYAPIGPATVPHVISVALAALSIWTGFEAWRGDFPKRDVVEVKPVVWVIAGLAAQMLLLKHGGFSVATGLLFAFTAFGFGRRKLWATIPIGIGFAFAIWLIFSKLLQLALPAGPLERLFF